MSAISCQQRQFGTLETGQAVTCYSLRNTSGMTISLLDHGAILNAVQIPDIRGEMHELTFGPAQISGLQTHHFSSGSTIAHIPSRYSIAFDAIQQAQWEAESITQDEAASIRLSLIGTLDLKYSFTKLEYQLITEYTLTAANELIIRNQIQTNIPLPIFITQHPIWNLAGMDKKDISDHILQIWASQYAEIDQAGLIHSGYMDVQDHPACNFQQPQRISEKHAQAPHDTNYDVCFKLLEQQALPTLSTLPLAARVKAPVSGRTLEVYTKQAGLRFYIEPKSGLPSQGFCLAPMPLCHATNHATSFEQSVQQETCYKLIW